METDSWKVALDAWPRFDRRYYEQTEQIVQRWLSEWRAAGVVAPISVLLCTVWLGGYMFAHLPRPLRWLEVIGTTLWLAGAIRASASPSDHSTSPHDAT